MICMQLKCKIKSNYYLYYRIIGYTAQLIAIWMLIKKQNIHRLVKSIITTNYNVQWIGLDISFISLAITNLLQSTYIYTVIHIVYFQKKFSRTNRKKKKIVIIYITRNLLFTNLLPLIIAVNSYGSLINNIIFE